MRFRQRRIQRQSFGGGCFGLRKAFLGRNTKNIADIEGIGKTDIGESEIWIL